MDFKKIEEILEEKGVKYEIRPEEGYGLVEFWTDTAGQDIPTEFNFDGTPEGFIKEFVESAESYDVDNEVELFANMRGKQGVPDTIRELLDDCQEAKDTLLDIAKALKEGSADEHTIIGFDSTIYCDALTLLFSDKADIKEMVREQMQQSDFETDQIRSDTDMPVDLLDVFSEASIDSLMEYISVDEERVTFDYSESQTCGDLKCVAFNVPCGFDIDSWSKEVAA